MPFADTLFVGIDISSSRKPFAYAALDGGLNLVAHSDGGLDETLAFLVGQPSAAAAVNALSEAGRGTARGKKKEMGLTLARKLEAMGFQQYPAENAPHQFMKTRPAAVYSALAGCALLPKSSVEGKLQRQLLLYEVGARIKDPMDFFEEITRYKILKGQWPLDLLYPPGRLDALAAAYLAWLAFHKPEKVFIHDDPREGIIALPETPKEKY